MAPPTSKTVARREGDGEEDKGDSSDEADERELNGNDRYLDACAHKCLSL